jgi:ADP-heptose:LPS heptosyltransferase
LIKACEAEGMGQRILILKQSSLGDVVHTLPVVHALKRCFPTSHIGWVVEKGFVSLLERDPAVEITYPMHIPSTSSPDASWTAYPQALAALVRTCLQLRNQFRVKPYDLVLDLHASFRSGLFALMNPGGIRLGFAHSREFNILFQHRLVRGAESVVHAVDKNLLFCEAFGCVVRDEDFHIHTSQADTDQAEQFLAASNLGDGTRFVYVNPTARWQSKFWIAKRWSALCDRLREAGLGIVFGGSGGDLNYISSITAQMNHQGLVAAGRLSLTESVALMKRAAVYIGLDTGPMHIAAMAGIPVVALFGPTHPERVGPYRVPHRIVRAEGLPCLCCRKRTCPKPLCMEGISVDVVYARVLELLEVSRAT